VDIEQRKTVDGGRHLRVLGAQDLLPDRQRALKELLGTSVVTLPFVDTG